jgi:TRAP-type C4-dicarboxylate transport system permease small subunit
VLVFFAFAALALFWVCFIALAKFERGWVGVTDLQRAMLRMVGGFRLMTIALGEALLPIVRKTTKQLVAFNEAMERDRG